ncbi:MAG TPA: response regulator, partial [Abditibacterium sp.]
MAKILVVDDTRNIRKMVQLALEKVGHSVEVAEDGAEGLERFGDGSNWDLTLVDQQMPRVEGRELIVEARARDPLARLVMMTAFATSELAAEVLQSGASDFLRKPFSTDTLRDAVETALAAPRGALPQFGNEIPQLIEPGQAGFSLPRTSYRFNGFSFWPVEPAAATPHGFDFGHVFQVRHPDSHLSACFVGITPHIREQMQRETVEDI